MVGVSNQVFFCGTATRSVAPRRHTAFSGAWHVHVSVPKIAGYPFCGARIRVGVSGSGIVAVVA